MQDWHTLHLKKRTRGQVLADKLVALLGSWNFIIIQSIIVLLWVLVNLFAYYYQWDPYPFILLNLLFSVQAAYAGPVMVMSQNRQAERDRARTIADFETNIEAKKEIEQIQVQLDKLEREKIDKILEILNQK